MVDDEIVGDGDANCAIDTQCRAAKFGFNMIVQYSNWHSRSINVYRLSTLTGTLIYVVVLNSDFTVDGNATTRLVAGHSVAEHKVIEICAALDGDITISAAIAPAIVNDVVCNGGVVGFHIYSLMVLPVRYITHSVV
jgi:hypothetical protein